jgi:hypothetical protein
MSMSRVALVGVVLLLVVVVVVARTRVGRETSPVAVPPPTTAEPTAAKVAPAPTLGLVTRSSGCQYRVSPGGAMLPDTACTPGATNPELTRDVLCAPGFSTRRYRRVTEAQKRAAFARYGIGAHAAGDYEVDHLIPLEDGGANEDANLWPQPASPQPGFHQKDLVETYVHREVCAGVMDLGEGQLQIASDWTVLLTAATRAGLAPKSHTDDGDESD